ncbi:MAG TPA: hypothetical protein VL972_09265 [Solirubrobacteraceae bacterium]|nr:hypothetical protein [Solirubrobacteraceae bacterium]
MALVALLVGCGTSDNGVATKTAQEILSATRAAAEEASSVHVASRSTFANTSLILDARLAKATGEAHASLLGITVEAIRSGGTLYVRGNRAFSRNLEHTLGVRVPAGRWLKGPTSGALEQAASFVEFNRELPVALGGSGKATKGAVTKVAGHSAIEVIQAHELSKATLYVSTTGEPYPLKLINRGRESGRTTFTEWNDPVHVDPPAHAIDISQLPKAGG